ncbi:MAG: di-trans,poly-cis-decaprenylcistransferase [Candidatus Brockarchaeota archaeon]|nr:di-trans,poly-cis-decaprenylcistransferase [Candidatus Brockarchaeota archaeon]
MRKLLGSLAFRISRNRLSIWLYEKSLLKQVSQLPMPNHIGIIMDGNRRWAELKGLDKSLGHVFGAKKVEDVLKWCYDLGIKTLTLYVLSTENLKRPPEEIQLILSLFKEKLVEIMNKGILHEKQVRFKVIGRRDLIPIEIMQLIEKLEKETEGYSSHYLNIAFAYGGRAEIVDAVRSIARDVSKKLLDPESIDEETISSRLYTAHLPQPDPDLIIRTSGEERLSNFLLWQSAYSELVFIDVYWPEFRKIDLLRAIRTYQKRKRRFGL